MHPAIACKPMEQGDVASHLKHRKWPSLSASAYLNRSAFDRCTAARNRCLPKIRRSPPAAAGIQCPPPGCHTHHHSPHEEPPSAISPRNREAPPPPPPPHRLRLAVASRGGEEEEQATKARVGGDHIKTIYTIKISSELGNSYCLLVVGARHCGRLRGSYAHLTIMSKS